MERDPDTIKDMPPQIGYPDIPVTEIPSYRIGLIAEKICTRPMRIWMAPNVLTSSFMNFLGSNVVNDIFLWNWFDVCVGPGIVFRGF
jgi:hypothetical protein